ncbi:MAG: hypothetical protein ACOC1D_04995 [Prolixibacteraceae bacterium]
MKENIDRRNFIKQGALGSAGILLGSSMAANAAGFFSRQGINNNGLGGLVPVSVIEDTNLLLLRSGNFKEHAGFALASDLHTRPAAPGNKGRIASVLPVQDKKLLQLLRIIRDDKKLTNRVEKIAIAFGWICHNAAARHIKPVYGNNPAAEEILEIQSYHDAQLIKEISGIKVSAKVNEEYIASLFNEMLPRAATRVHTLIPASDGPEWVNRITDWRVENKSYLENLAKIIVRPENSKKVKYVDSPNFYAPSDSVIFCCRNLQKAIDVKPAKIKKAVSEASTGSLYARALGEAYTNIANANEYLNGNLSEQELDRKLF